MKYVFMVAGETIGAALFLWFMMRMLGGPDE